VANPRPVPSLFAVFYAVVALLKTEKLIKAGIILFLGSGLIFSIICILGMIRSNVKYLDELFKISVLIPKVNFKLPGAEIGFHPNAVGAILILIIPLYFILFFSYSRRKRRNSLGKRKNNLIFITGLIGLITITIVLILTQSRGSWIGLILSSFLLLIPGKRKKWGVILIVISIAAYLLLLGFDKIPLGAKEARGKITSRMELWNLAVDTIGEHPVFGVGMNRVRQLPEVGYKTAHVHNHLLHTGAELGIPGLLGYLAILAGAGFMCYEVWRKAKVGWMRTAVLGLACGQLAHLIFGMADSIPLGAKPGFIFWYSLALIAAMYNYMIRERG